jgi:DNA-binding CsgD family transcriptional regulator
LLKTSSSEHLVAAVRAAVLDPASQAAVVGMPEEMLEETGTGAEGVISARELEILLLAARGLSNERIASSLHIAEATVKRHLADVYQKMGVSSRGEASREALLREWITIEEVTEPGGGPLGGDPPEARGRSGREPEAIPKRSPLLPRPRSRGGRPCSRPLSCRLFRPR